MTLSLRDIRFAYPSGETVLNDVSFDAPAGVTVLLGPNGCGKSTLLRIAMGMNRPQSGEARIDGVPVLLMPHRERRRRVAFVPQRPRPDVLLSVRDVLALGAGGRDHQRVYDVIDRFNMGAIAERPFATLSTGQQQEVTFARAILQLEPASEAGSPAVLLADEPFSALDPAHIRRCLRMLGSLQSAGSDLAVLIVLHDFLLARRMADRVVLLNDSGGVAASGCGEAVMTSERLSEVYGAPFGVGGAAAAGLILPSLLPDEEGPAGSQPI